MRYFWRDTTLGMRTPGGFGLFSKLAALSMKWVGWQVAVADPLPEKCVIVMYPHTSNWDFPVGLLSKWSVGLDWRHERMCFAGKESLCKGPWAGFFGPWVASPSTALPPAVSCRKWPRVLPASRECAL